MTLVFADCKLQVTAFHSLQFFGGFDHCYSKWGFAFFPRSDLRHGERATLKLQLGYFGQAIGAFNSFVESSTFDSDF